MSTDCRWFEDNLDIDPKKVQEHVDHCRECREAVEQLPPAVDPLVHQVFLHNLAIARLPRAPRRLAAPVYVAVAAALAIAAWIGVRTSQIPSDPAPAIAHSTAPQATVPATAADVPPPVIKAQRGAPLERAKPQPASAPNTASPVPATNAEANAAPFLVSDAAGYSRTLADFRGHILIFGIWNSHDPNTVTAMQQIYESFSSDSRLRILGVSNEAHAKPAAGTFPVVYNEGSRLMGAKGAALFIVDGKGKVRFRGSLVDDPDALLKSVRSTLDGIGDR